MGGQSIGPGQNFNTSAESVTMFLSFFMKESCISCNPTPPQLAKQTCDRTRGLP